MKAPASLLSNTFLTDATVDGDAKAPVVLDTGAPFSLLGTAYFGGKVPVGVGMVATLTIGGMTLFQVPTIGENNNPSLGGGLVGFTAFGQFDLSLNYRDGIVSFGAAALPAGLVAGRTVVPFELAGGGFARASASGNSVVQFPASRVLVPADIEGERHLLLVDSGASVVALRKSIFDRLSADGRGTVQQQFLLASGQTTNNLIRLRSVVVGGAEVTDPAAASGSGIETLVASLSDEVGQTVDGMLGGTFLREFYVTVGYPEGSLILERYANRSFIHDEFRRVGIELALASHPPPTYVVQQIYPNTNAEITLARADVREGDSILAVDGKTLPDDPAAADAMFLGNVGTTHDVTFGAEPPRRGQVTLTLRVDELLPLP